MILKQTDLTWDEYGLTVAHYIALSSAITQPGSGYRRSDFQHDYNTRWSTDTTRRNIFKTTPEIHHKPMSFPIPQLPLSQQEPVQPQSQQTGFSFGVPVPQQGPPQPQQSGFTLSLSLFEVADLQPAPLQSQQTGFSFGAAVTQQGSPQPQPQSQQISFGFGAPVLQQGSPNPQPIPPQSGFNYTSPVEPSQVKGPNVATSSTSVDSKQAFPFTFDTSGFMTQLAAATHLIEEIFTSHKEALNIRSEFGETPLLAVCKVLLHSERKIEIVRQLVKLGADVKLAVRIFFTKFQ